MWEGGSFYEVDYWLRGELLDLCVLDEAIRWASHGSSVISPDAMLEAQRERQWLGCDGTGLYDPITTARFVAYSYDDRGYFETREEAEAYLRRADAAYEWQFSNHPPPDAHRLGQLIEVFGPFHSGIPRVPQRYSIEYSDAAIPVDEVVVLPGSLSVRDGVLRGLVRNWSPRLFAFNVTVTTADHVWRWPLSIQPGETAPFEFKNWNGPVDPQLARYEVSAEMSPDVDLSRSFEIVGGDFVVLLESINFEYLPPELVETFPAGIDYLPLYVVRPALYASAESRESLDSEPDSHRSAGNAASDLSQFEMSAWRARFDSQGRITDIEPLRPFWYPPIMYLDGIGDDRRSVDTYDFNHDGWPNIVLPGDPAMYSTGDEHDSQGLFGRADNPLSHADSGMMLWIGGAHRSQRGSES
ncbi:hypothetical protein [Candidatus Poriferisodalis sp.]|uniref:hypothetical protein n=1 Tax=Candidatus Poriferisodalis sp. TaxID=3101277 RepID=UPI003AF55182